MNIYELNKNNYFLEIFEHEDSSYDYILYLNIFKAIIPTLFIFKYSFN